VGDYGAIILMDERYRTTSIELSKWLNMKKRVYMHFGDIEKDLA
jgi:Rad3-related DNA helicase